MDIDLAPSMTSILQNMIEEIIEHAKITTVFQPIISLRDGSTLGYEALSRGPVNTPLHTPDALFAVATDCGKLWELEQLCRTKALENAFKSGADFKLFLNVNPNVIHDEKFQRGFTREYLDAFAINPENIIFEITEKSAVEDLSGFRKTIENYKRQNYEIAIDDAGAGYSGLNMITDIHPHYIKLDMNLIRDIDKNGYKKALVKSLYEFCRVANISLIAEGVETVSEMDVLIDIGVHYAQGYLIQRPAKDLAPIQEPLLQHIQNRNAKRNHLFYHDLSSIYIDNLCTENPTISPSEMAENVYAVFVRNELLQGMTVVDDGRVLGIVTRMRIDHMMSGQFGYSLHAKRSIARIMETHPLVVDCHMAIDIVAKMAMSRPAYSMYNFIIVTCDNQYHGIVTIKDLLEKTMEFEVTNARHLNPLTGLPGNMMIEHQLTRCVESTDPFTILYLDIDNFKPYNDVYGFENGDNVIRAVAQLLINTIPRGSFVGHVGGDDFVAIIHDDDAEILCDSIIKQFDMDIKIHFNAEDLHNGFIIAKNRRGEEDHFPITTLSISCVTNRTRQYDSIYQLTEHAGAVKKRCKQIWQSCFIIE